jgi:hypothetical protein
MRPYSLFVGRFLAALLFPISLISGGAHAETIELIRQLGTAQDDYANGISADPLGNVYLTGDTGGSLGGPNPAGGRNGFVTKYDPAGTMQWSRQFGTNYSFGTAVSAALPGAVYVSGFTADTLAAPMGGGEDAFLIR